MVEVQEGAFAGHKWADPAVASLRGHLRAVVDDPDRARAKGERARRDVEELWTADILGRQFLEEAWGASERKSARLRVERERGEEL